jgi:hypothetical protein
MRICSICHIPIYGHSKADKCKSCAHSNKKLSEETKNKIRLAHLNKPLSEEHKEKISESMSKNKAKFIYKCLDCAPATRQSESREYWKNLLQEKKLCQIN